MAVNASRSSSSRVPRINKRPTALFADTEGEIPKTQSVTAAYVFDLFLDHSQRHNQPDTFEVYRYYLDDLCGIHGRRMALDLKPIHITRWLDSHPKWRGSRRNAIVAIKRAFNWADKQGVLTPNALGSLEKPPPCGAEVGFPPRKNEPKSWPRSRTRTSATSFSRFSFEDKFGHYRNLDRAGVFHDSNVVAELKRDLPDKVCFVEFLPISSVFDLTAKTKRHPAAA